MANFIPKMGSKGLYTCKEPFNYALLNGVLYQPVAIRSFADIIASGVDPYKEYYLPQQISKESYNADVLAGVFIVSLRTDSGVTAYIPTSYIVGQPDIGGVPYRTMILGISLAPIPESLDLTLLQTRVSDLVFDSLGVRARVDAVVASAASVVSQAEHDAIEATRAVVIANNKTDYAKYLVAMNELAEARLKISMLEKFITDNQPA